MANKYFDGKVQFNNSSEEVDNELIGMVNSLEDKVGKNIDILNISEALTDIFDVLRRSNKYIDETSPWLLAKEESSRNRLELVLYNLLESIRVVACELSPFIPSTCEEIFRQLNISDKVSKYNEDNIYQNMENVPLFVRIQKEEK